MGFMSGVLSDFWASCDGVSVLTFALDTLYLCGPAGLGFRRPRIVLQMIHVLIWIVRITVFSLLVRM